jgi:sulfur-oxidizing protein SoxY
MSELIVKPYKQRRIFLQTCFSLFTILLNPIASRAAWLADFFAPVDINEAIKTVFGNAEIIMSDQILLNLPSIAENGAVVPITVTSTLEQVTQVAIFVEKNPIPLVALFELSTQVEPFVSARLKVADSSNIVVILKSADKLYQTNQIVKVTIGGCGG